MMMKDSISLRPSHDIVAGSTGIWKLDYLVGKGDIKQGGSLKVILPYHGVVNWHIGDVYSCTDAKAKLVEYISFIGLNRLPMARIMVEKGHVEEGKRIIVIFGNLSGIGQETRAQCYVEDGAQFKVEVDRTGSGVYQSLKGPKVNIIPGKAQKLCAFGQAIPTLGKPFRLTITICDRYGNRTIDYRGAISFRSKNISNLPKRYKFSLKDRGSHAFKCSLRAKQKAVIEVKDNLHKLKAVSNPIVPNFLDSGYNIYFGDLHAHSGMSLDGLGSLDDHYLYAKEVMGLDFAAVTDHVYHLDKEKWQKTKEAVRRHYIPHRFVSFLGYEWDAYRNAHIGILFFSDRGERILVKSPEELWKKLKGKEVIAIPHHPNAVAEHLPLGKIEGWQNYDWDKYHPDFQPLVEICQPRGSFEKDQTGGIIFQGGYGSSIQDALAKGYKIGFTGGSDTHLSRPGSPEPGDWGRKEKVVGLTAIMAKRLTRESLWEALKNRRTYVTTGERILLNFYINEYNIGEVIKLNTNLRKTRSLHLNVIGTDRIAKIEIIRNNKIFYSINGRWKTKTLCLVDNENVKKIYKFKDIQSIYYYVRITQADGNMAWSSPIWFVD